MDVSQRLLDICSYYRINVSELADVIGLSKSTVLSYTRERSTKGPVMPGLDIAPKIFKAFPRLSLEWFFFNEGEIEKQDIGKSEIANSDFRDKYYEILEKYSSIQEELIDCLKGHPEGIPPLKPRQRVTG